MSQIKLTPEQIVALADEHIHHYENLLRGGARFGIRPSECQSYINIWQHTKHCIETKQPITIHGKTEIFDAVLSGDYNHLLDLDDEIEISEIIFPHNP